MFGNYTFLDGIQFLPNSDSPQWSFSIFHKVECDSWMRTFPDAQHPCFPLLKWQVTCRNASDFGLSKQPRTILHLKYTSQAVFGPSLHSPLLSDLMPTAGSGNLSPFLTAWGIYRGSCVGSREERSPSWPSLCSCMRCEQFHRAARGRKTRTQRLIVKAAVFLV